VCDEESQQAAIDVSMYLWHLVMNVQVALCHLVATSTAAVLQSLPGWRQQQQHIACASALVNSCLLLQQLQTNEVCGF
jgi:hypothetical protein